MKAAGREIITRRELITGVLAVALGSELDVAQARRGRGGVAAAGQFGVAISGSSFVSTATGKTVQLRGVNVSGLEGALCSYDQRTASNYWIDSGWASTGPPFNIIANTWKANIVRIPLNEAAWLGLTVTDTDGHTFSADNQGLYQTVVANTVAAAVAQGLYVILDLHWCAPGTISPQDQSQMVDADHSVTFWTQVANAFKSNPAVLFEIFNEPYFNFDYNGSDSFADMLQNGGSFSGIQATSSTGNTQDLTYAWTSASYQACLNAIRATGATNVVLCGCDLYSSDMSGWLAHKPVDSLHQVACVWHSYYAADSGGANYQAPQCFNFANAIIAAGIPVLVTETGDNSTPTGGGGTTAPNTSATTSWADANGQGVLGWGFNPWNLTSDVLITDTSTNSSVAPSGNYGQFFYNWLTNHA